MSKAIPGFLIVAALVCAIVPPYTVGMNTERPRQAPPPPYSPTPTNALTRTDSHASSIIAECPRVCDLIIVKYDFLSGSEGKVYQYLLASYDSLPRSYLMDNDTDYNQFVPAVMAKFGFTSHGFKIHGLVDRRAIHDGKVGIARLIYLIKLNQDNKDKCNTEQPEWHLLSDSPYHRADSYKYIEVEFVPHLKFILDNKVSCYLRDEIPYKTEDELNKQTMKTVCEKVKTCNDRIRKGELEAKPHSDVCCVLM